MAAMCFRGSWQRARLLLFLAALVAAMLLAYYLFNLRFTAPREPPCANATSQAVEERRSFFNRRLSSRLSEKYRGETLPGGNGSDVWKGSLPGLYVYSAYVERTDSATWQQVRLIGVVSKKSRIFSKMKAYLKCRIRAQSLVIFGTAKVKNIPEDHSFEFTAAFVICTMREQLTVNCCERVQVALEYHPYPMTWIDVHQPGNNRSEDVISLCVRPLFGPYDNLFQLVEFILYYSVVGVRHYSFYIYQATENVNRFFRFLREKHSIVADIRSWDLPVDSSLIHELGQLAFTQDCIYRARLTSKYVLIVDLDEFVVPKHSDTLPGAIMALETTYSPQTTGSYIVMNHFFCLEHTPETALVYTEIPLLTRLFTIREKGSWKHRVRSKYIARGDATVAGGIHFVWEHVPGALEVHIPEDVMVMHHYRRCCGMTRIDTEWFTDKKVNVLQDVDPVDDIEMRRFTKDMLELPFTTSLVDFMESGR